MEKLEIDSYPQPNALVITLKSEHQNLNNSFDVVETNNEYGFVEKIAPYSPSKTSQNLKTNISSGIVYIASPVAEKMLLLSSQFPFVNCVYLGEDDGGSENLEVFKTSPFT